MNMLRFILQKKFLAGLSGLMVLTLPGAALAAGEINGTPPSQGTLNANTGLANESVIGNGSMRAQDTGIAVNGSKIKDSNLNNNQNQNSNINLVQPNVIGHENRGGSAALVLPRNPLPMPNAALGRSNFGLQMGVQNNPGLPTMGGAANALGWFMQAGLTIPFGKIPEVYNNPNRASLDDDRKQQLQASRNVFGDSKSGQNNNAGKKVSGKVVGLSAYNYTTTPSGRVNPSGGPSLGKIEIPQPRVLALAPSDAYTQPLDTGQKAGVIEAGKEYVYLGHTSSGWVKLLLPTGSEAWTVGRFEYVKYDFTQIDALASRTGRSRTTAQVPTNLESIMEKAPDTAHGIKQGGRG
jgi:hypothetical protein